ncbi:hypothetical protein MASR2M17_17280 [Aminivibrio sp.]
MTGTLATSFHWAFSDSLAAGFVVEALDERLKVAVEIINSDQAPSTRATFIRIRAGKRYLHQHGRKGVAWTASSRREFWRSYKREEVYLKEYEPSRSAARRRSTWHYNFNRPPSVVELPDTLGVILGEKAKKVNIK